ncbi:MAG TPA: HRDC domain-containing protein [Rudaea sp.]|nr:HRDC domain-containing protein [Rudaea sp.]
MHDWIDDTAALERWFGALAPPAPIGLDTEFLRTDTFRPRLALIQANIDGRIALLDAPKLGAHAPLAAALADARNVCIMHSASEDLEALAAIVPTGPGQLFDTQTAAAMVGLGASLSYQKLVALLLGIDLPKAETRSDWFARPLSAAQIDYAVQDVAHLPVVHAELARRLEALGRSAWLAEDCRRLVDKVCQPEADDEPQRAFRTAADWPLARQALLRRVLLWREATARRIDKPRRWILDDVHILAFVAEPPATSEALFERSRGLRALRGPLRQELLELLHAPLDAGELAIAPIPAAPSTAEKRLVNSLRDEVARIAGALGVPEGLLCARRHLEALATERRWPAALDGWRRGVLFDELTRIVPVPS